MALRAAIADDRVPVTVRLFLIFRRDLEGKGLGVPERRLMRVLVEPQADRFLWLHVRVFLVLDQTERPQGSTARSEAMTDQSLPRRRSAVDGEGLAGDVGGGFGGEEDG